MLDTLLISFAEMKKLLPSTSAVQTLVDNLVAKTQEIKAAGREYSSLFLALSFNTHSLFSGTTNSLYMRANTKHGVFGLEPIKPW
jgi:hypothetical protein